MAKPFAGTSKQPTESFGVLAFSTAVTWIVWMALIVPSFMKLSIGEHLIVAQPFGSWPAFVAFCQAFVIFSIMPVEGAELYPMKLFAKKQPQMAIIGFIIALASGFIMPAILRSIITPLNLVPGTPPDVIVASLELSIIVFMLTWHHLFGDYPNAKLSPNTAIRVLTRIAIWFIGGGVYGVLWLKTFKLLPIGANDLGLGIPTMGILAGQFALLMTILFFNTFLDKWPLVRKQGYHSITEATLSKNHKIS
jgi:AAT family amino acid transporter